MLTALRRFSNTYARFRVDNVYDPVKHTNISAFPWYTEDTAQKASSLKPSLYWKALFNANSYNSDIQTIYRRFLQSVATMDKIYMQMCCEPVFMKKMYHITREIHRDGFMFDITNIDLRSKVTILDASLVKGIPISREAGLPIEPPKYCRLRVIGPQYLKYKGAELQNDLLDIDNSHYIMKVLVKITTPMRLFLMNQNRSGIIYKNETDTCILQLEAGVKWYEMFRLLPTKSKAGLYDAWKITDYNFLLNGNERSIINI